MDNLEIKVARLEERQQARDEQVREVAADVKLIKENHLVHIQATVTRVEAGLEQSMLLINGSVIPLIKGVESNMNEKVRTLENIIGIKETYQKKEFTEREELRKKIRDISLNWFVPLLLAAGLYMIMQWLNR